MPYVETPEDLAEFLADAFGIYGAHDINESEPCKCRVHWVPTMADRIRKAVENEKKLEKMND